MKQGHCKSILMQLTEGKRNGHQEWTSFLIHRRKEHHNRGCLRQALHRMVLIMSPMQEVRYPSHPMRIMATTAELKSLRYLSPRNPQVAIRRQTVLIGAPTDLDAKSSLGRYALISVRMEAVLNTLYLSKTLTEAGGPGRNIILRELQD